MPFRSGAHGTYVPCGTCPACKAEKANKRASVIKSTNPLDKLCYFVTLTYSNAFLPYVEFCDLYASYERYLKYSKSDDPQPFVVPVYRNSYFTYGRGSRKQHFERKEIGYLIKDEIKLPQNQFELAVKQLMSPTDGCSGYDMHGCFSVAFNEDKDLFLNRLRKRIFMLTGNYDTLKYFYAPEYGPTTSRFHIHLLIWCTTEISSDIFKQLCKECWPYMDYSLPKNKDFCQLAVNPANYVSQYVNCSSEISPLLLEIAPVRCSRSVGIGFDVPQFELSSISPTYKDFNFDYYSDYVAREGVVKTSHGFLPPRVSYRYFPRCKSFSRLNEPRMVALYDKIFHGCSLFHCGYRYKKFYKKVDGTIKIQYRKLELYRLPITDVFNQSISVTEDEYRGFRKRLIEAYLRYYEFRKCRPKAFFKHIFAYYSKYAQFRYYLQFNHPDMHGFFDFDNMDDYFDTISTIIPPGLTHLYTCNENPYNIEHTKELTDKFNRNIKQRKLNYIPNY